MHALRCAIIHPFTFCNDKLRSAITANVKTVQGGYFFEHIQKACDISILASCCSTWFATGHWYSSLTGSFALLRKNRSCQTARNSASETKSVKWKFQVQLIQCRGQMLYRINILAVLVGTFVEEIHSPETYQFLTTAVIFSYNTYVSLLHKTECLNSKLTCSYHNFKSIYKNIKLNVINPVYSHWFLFSNWYHLREPDRISNKRIGKR